MNKKKFSLDDDLININESKNKATKTNNSKYARINISFEQEFLEEFKIWCVTNNLKYNQAIKIAVKDYMNKY